MRALFTTQPATGHFHPLVPLAQALESAGHQVAFACSPSFCPTVEESGFLVFPAGLDWLGAEITKKFPRMREVFIEQGAQAAAAWVNEEVFAGVAAERMIPDLISLVHNWHPDVVVRDLTEFGGYIAAEALKLPHATVEVGAFHPYFWREEAISRQLNSLRAMYSLPHDPNLDRLYPFLHLSFVPPEYQDPAIALPPTTHVLQWVVFDRSGDETLPVWVRDLPSQPTIYATLGTAVNRRRDIFQSILAGLRDEALNLIMTVGRNQNPSDFGSQPSNVHIERYIPQSLLLPHCDLVMSHGGFNTVLATIRYGLPQAVIPLGGDQPNHARRCEVLEIGRVIMPDKVTPDSVRHIVTELLQDGRYRSNAQRLRDSMLTLKRPEHGVSLLERLVNGSLI